MKSLHRFPLFVLGMLIGTSPAFSQDSVGWNYVGRSNSPLASDQIAGAPGFQQDNWNNHSGSGQGPGDTPLSNLTDNAGNATTAELTTWTLSQSNSWSHTGAPSPEATPDELLTIDFVNREASLTFNEIPFTDNGYTVVVYYGNNEGPSTSQLNVGLASRDITTGDTAGSYFVNTGYVEGTDDNTDVPTNYSVFPGNNSSAITVSLSGTNNNGISAVQLVAESSAGPPGIADSPLPATGTNTPESVDVNFGWSAPLRANQYDIFLWPDGQAEPATPTATVDTNAYDPPANLTPLTRYNWKIVSRNTIGNTTTAGPTWTFETDVANAPAPPDSPTPLDGATSVFLETTLDWSDSAASSYNIFLWEVDAFKPLTPTAVTNTSSYEPTGLTEGTAYRWTVEAVNGFGTTPATDDFWSFSTINAPQGNPAAPKPGNEASSIKLLPLLEWDDVTGASSYEIRLWEASGPKPVEPTSTISISQYQVAALLEIDSDYSWEVIALNPVGSSTSPTWTFTTAEGFGNTRSLGWNFTVTGAGSLEPTEAAGAPGFAQASWNNHVAVGQGPGDPLVSLLDNAGDISGVSVSWTQTTNNSWYHNQTDSSDEKLLNDFADTEPVVTFEGITYPTYDVIVYYGNNEGPDTSTLTVNGTERVITTGNTDESSIRSIGYTEGTDENPDTPSNYAIFGAVQGETLQVSLDSITLPNPDVGNNNGLSAIQIIQSDPGFLFEFQVTMVRITDLGPEITFQSVANEVYRVERSLDLVTWSPVANNLSATSASTTFTDSSLAGNAVEDTPKTFYRVIRIE